MCSVTSGLQSQSTASYLQSLGQALRSVLCVRPRPGPLESQPQGGAGQGPSCYRARAARSEGRDFEVLPMTAGAKQTLLGLKKEHREGLEARITAL